MAFLAMLTPETPSLGDATPDHVGFLDIARFILALVVVVGGGLMLAFGVGRISPEALVGIIALVLGYYFGVASSRQAQQAAYNGAQRAMNGKDSP